jgi:hypothetical protein
MEQNPLVLSLSKHERLPLQLYREAVESASNIGTPTGFAHATTGRGTRVFSAFHLDSSEKATRPGGRGVAPGTGPPVRRACGITAGEAHLAEELLGATKSDIVVAVAWVVPVAVGYADIPWLIVPRAAAHGAALMIPLHPFHRQ